jgi:DHA2 family multidrug resistance protein-like MFS transporter
MEARLNALGIATLGSIGTAVYRGQITDGAPATVRESIAAAVATAQRLPGPAGTEPLAQAQRAFTSALHVVVLVSAVLLTARAIVILTWLRHLPLIGDTRAAPEPPAEPATGPAR